MSYQLFMMGMKGERKIVGVANSEEEFRNTTVEELKRKIALPGDETYRECRLIYNDTATRQIKELKDHYTLGDYGIRKRSTICCVIRLPGGYLPEGEDGGIHRTESMEKLKLSM